MPSKLQRAVAVVLLFAATPAAAFGPHDGEVAAASTSPSKVFEFAVAKLQLEHELEHQLSGIELPNSVLPAAMTSLGNQGDQVGEDQNPTTSLLYVLLQTFVAIGAGYLCVRSGVIDGLGDDMKAVRFVVGRLSLPLMSFNVIATSPSSELDWGIVLACSLGKVLTGMFAFGASYCCYRSRASRTKRFLNSTLCGFFQWSTNDFAIGIPVIQALYGSKMSGYLAANVLVFQLILQPLALVCLEVGNSFRQDQLRQLAAEGGSMGAAQEQQQRSSPALSAAKHVFSNPIVLATIAGALFLLLLPGTRTEIDGKPNQLPHPLYDVVSVLISPFKMLFLFLNGTSLSNFNLKPWAAVLVMLKVIVCAFLTYLLAEVLMGSHHTKDQRGELLAFSFYYGTIPTGGAPLVFATQFAPWLVDVMAGSCLYALVLAAPVEFMSALVLGVGDAQGAFALRSVQYTMTVMALTCGVFFAIYFSLTVFVWDSSRCVFAIYGAVCSLYAFVAFFILTGHWDCHSELVVHMFGWFQTSCTFTVLFMHALLVLKWPSSRWIKLGGTAIVVLISLLPPFLITLPHTLREMCHWELNIDRLLRTTFSDLFSIVIHMALLGVGLYQKRQARRRSYNEELAGDAAAILERQEPSTAVRLLVIFQLVRLLVEAVTSATVAIWEPKQTDAFLPMFIMVNIMEFGQMPLLLFVTLFWENFSSQRQALLSTLSCGGFLSIEEPAETAAAPARSFLGPEAETPVAGSGFASGLLHPEQELGVH